MAFGLPETLFLVVVCGASYVTYKIANTYWIERKAKIKIDKVLKDPELLIDKLNNPQIEIGGEMVRVPKVIDDGNVSEFKLNADNKIERIKTKIAPRPSVEKKQDKKIKSENKNVN